MSLNEADDLASFFSQTIKANVMLQKCIANKLAIIKTIISETEKESVILFLKIKQLNDLDIIIIY